MTDRRANFLNDNRLVASARQLFRAFQLLAGSVTGLTPVIRGDHARNLAKQIADRRNLSFLARFGLALHARTFDRVPDLVQQRAGAFILFSKAELRPVLVRIPVGTLPVENLTGVTRLAESGAPAVFLTLGFLGAMAPISDWFAAATPYWGRARVVAGEAAEAIVKWLTYSDGQGSSPREPPLTVRKHLYSGGLFFNAINFALAHEYAHVLLDYMRREGESAWVDSVTLESVEDTQMNDELKADVLASYLALSVASNPMNFHSTLREGAAGIELVLQIDRVAEQLRVRGTVSGHPPASLRLAAVHAAWKQLYSMDLEGYVAPVTSCGQTAVEHATALREHRDPTE